MEDTSVYDAVGGLPFFVALVDRFYAEGPSAEIEAQAAALLARHPEHAGLHEIAAYRAQK